MSSVGYSPLAYKPIDQGCSIRTQAYTLPDFAKHSEHLSLTERIKLALEWDKKDEFVNLVKGLTCKDDVKEITWAPMYGCDAVNCAGAILSGETHDKIHLQDTVRVCSPQQSSPIHMAAWFRSVKIIKLLLDCGESADARFEFSSNYNFKDDLPLNVALRSIWRWHSLRNYQNSPFKLIVQLSTYLTRQTLETVRQLALATKELDQEFLKYMKAGALTELCILLLVGCRLPPTSPLCLGDEIPRERKEAILDLFKIFDTVGDDLSAYLRIKRPGYAVEKEVAIEVTSIFLEAGLPLKCRDTVLDYPLTNGRRETYRLENLTVPSLALSQASSGLSTQGVRSFHSSIFRKTNGTLASSFDRKNLVKGLQSTGVCREFGFLAAALRRVSRCL